MRPSTTAASCTVRVILLLALLHGAAAAAEDALLMPRAAQSLLLDVVRAGDALVAVGERGHVLRSLDQGRSWMQVPVPTRAMLSAAWFVDAERGWAVGHDAVILHTADGGRTWALQRDGLAEQRAIDRYARREARARLKTLEGERAQGETPELAEAIEQATRDLEDAEAALEDPVFAPPLFDVWIGGDGQGLAVGAYGSALHTADGGRTWEDVRQRFADPDRRHLYAVAAQGDGAVLLVAGEAGALYRSTDRGASWATVASAHAGTLFGLAVAPGGVAVYAVGLQGALLRSTDAGQQWQALDSGTQVALAGATPTRDGLLIAGGMGSVLRVEGVRVTPLPVSARHAHFSAVIDTADGVPLAVGQGGAERLDAPAGASTAATRRAH